MKIVSCKVTGVAPQDRNFFGGMAQRRLEKEEIDLRIDWSGGDSGTSNMKIVVDCCKFDFPRIKTWIEDALRGTYLANPAIAPKNDLSKAMAA